MPTSLLATKLHPPPVRADWVARPRLYAALEAGRRVTVVCAPAGFGKSTLVTAWRAQSPAAPALAWLSLDDADNDPARFWAYLAAALERAAPGLGQPALALLGAPHPPPAETLITLFTNLLADQPRPLTLVLDDYHRLMTPALHEALAHWIDRAPEGLRFVLTSRIDPPLPLARWRARGLLAEVRAADLRFAPAEAAVFLRASMGLTISTAAVAALEARTEGWIAGLQLAGLALQQAPDPARFIAAFTGSHRHVLDYLSDDVFHRQPPSVQQFLLTTCVLDRLCAPLCEALEAGAAPAQPVLEQLERHNIFLSALDDERTWFRYHGLFSEALRFHLQREQPGRASDLHRRAARWHAAQGLGAEAVHHWLAAEAWEEAARLIVQLADQTLYRQGEIATLLRWTDALPEAAQATPEMRFIRLQALAYASRDAEARQLLARLRAEPLASALAVRLAVLEAMLVIRAGDFQAGVRLTRAALADLPPTAPLWRGEAAVLLGSALAKQHRPEEALAALEEAVAMGRAAQNAFVLFFATGLLSYTAIVRGALRRAEQVCLDLLAEWAPRPWPAFAGSILVSLALIHEQWDDVARAETEVATAIRLFEQSGYIRNLRGAYTTLALIRHAQGDQAGVQQAMALAWEAARRVGGDVTQTRDITVFEALLALYRGETPDWEPPATPTEDVTLRETEQLVLAHLRLAQGRWAEALAILEAERPRTAASGRWSYLLENELLTAVALYHLGQTAPARAALTRSLALAEPEGYWRIYLDKGPLVGGPLAALAPTLADPQLRGYARKLAAAFGPPARPASPALTEPLSEREQEVLHLIAAGLSNKAVAAQLVISPHTAKKHTLNIFGKLGVNSRTQALAAARRLGLLPE